MGLSCSVQPSTVRCIVLDANPTEEGRAFVSFATKCGVQDVHHVKVLRHPLSHLVIGPGTRAAVEQVGARCEPGDLLVLYIVGTGLAEGEIADLLRDWVDPTVKVLLLASAPTSLLCEEASEWADCLAVGVIGTDLVQTLARVQEPQTMAAFLAAMADEKGVATTVSRKCNVKTNLKCCPWPFAQASTVRADLASTRSGPISTGEAEVASEKGALPAVPELPFETEKQRTDTVATVLPAERTPVTRLQAQAELPEPAEREASEAALSQQAVAEAPERSEVKAEAERSEVKAEPELSEVETEAELSQEAEAVPELSEAEVEAELSEAEAVPELSQEAEVAGAAALSVVEAELSAVAEEAPELQ